MDYASPLPSSPVPEGKALVYGYSELRQDDTI